MMCMRVVVLLLGMGLHAAALAVPEIQHWRTDNGTRVYFVETHQLPMVSISFAFDAGSARDPQGKSGIANLTNLLMSEGAGELTGEQIHEQLESVGAQLGNDNGRDMSVYELRTLSDDDALNTALRVLADILARPTFPAAALDRERERELVKLAKQDQSPGEIARRTFYAELFAGHPYANPPNGDEAGLRTIQREHLQAFHKRFFTPGNGVLALVGDVTLPRARQIAEQLTVGLPRGGAAPSVSETPEVARTSERVIDFPSRQSHLLMGQRGMSRNDPDYFPLYVGNYILGGSGLISRLAVEIREKRGLAYSVYSSFQPMRERGPFSIGLQTRNDQRHTAVQVVQDTLNRFVEHGPTAEELEAAKQNITGGFPLQLDSNSKIAGKLMLIGFYRLPLDYLANFQARVQAVTIADVQDAFRRRIDPTRLVRVIVGGKTG